VTVGRVYLVGAGPGDPGLLTLRAAALLRSADVVAYDELVSPEILALAPATAERLAVGRRVGRGAISYRVHPEVLVRARAGKTVVRLKAGDPMVFGRGGEEAEELAEEGIPFEIVPGVSAALGAASYAGIPLTHRQHASRVTFATGHDVEHDPKKAGLGETLVLYMAGRRLAENMQNLVREGRAPSTPAAYIEAATTPHQRVVVGTIADLAARTAGSDPYAPAIVIVGDVVTVREHAAWFERAPRPLPLEPKA
jgi:uroporphyrinogen III methyltransferase/synthase